MRRLFILAAFLVVLSLVPVSAQRGGVRGGFGGHGGFGGRGGSMGHVGGHAFGGAPFGGVPFGGFKFSGGRGFRGHGFHHCFACRRGFGFPWYAGWGYGYYDPFWWDWSSSDNYDQYDQGREQEILLANQMNALNLQEQNLREREGWLRQREEEDAYARQAQTPTEAPAPAKPEPATVLVFRDQHQQEITNYAISGSTLWVLNDHVVAKKIPLTDLDLTATAKANDERGIEFQIPKK